MFVSYLSHSTHRPRNQRHSKTPSRFTAPLSQLIQVRRLLFLDTRQGWIRHLTSPEHSKSPSDGCPRTGVDHPVVLVIPGYAPWKQISKLLTLSSTQHGNTLRIENIGSTSWKPLRSSSWLARDDDDDDNDLHMSRTYVSLMTRFTNIHQILNQVER